MKAIVFPKPYEIEIRELPMPQIQNDTDVLVRIRAGGICGSDVHVYHGKNAFARYPLTMGHEMSGEVVEVGAAVEGLAPGDHIVLDPVNNCGACRSCRIGRGNVCENLLVNGASTNGVFAEYAVYNQKKLHKIDKNVPWDVAAMVEPFTIAAQSFSRGRLEAGDDVLIVGAGPIGQILLQAAKAEGANCTITDIVPERLEFAKRLGADHAVLTAGKSLKQVVEELGMTGFTIAFDAAGVPALMQEILDVMRPAGRVVFLGFSTVDTAIHQISVTGKELDLVGSRLSYSQFPKVVRWIEDGHVDPSKIITHHVPFEKALEGIKIIESEPDTCMKVVLEF